MSSDNIGVDLFHMTICARILIKDKDGLDLNICNDWHLALHFEQLLLTKIDAKFINLYS